jgi:glutamate racemase
MGEDVTLVSSNTETANDVYRTLVSQRLERTAAGEPSLRFEATGADAGDFLRLAHRFMGPEVSRVDLVQTGSIELPAP